MLNTDISKFTKYGDYLSIFNAVLITDLIVILLLLTGIIKSSSLKIWYKELQLSAVISDVFIIFIVLIITRFMYSLFFNTFVLWKFILLAVGIQIMHDLLFYKLVLSIPRGRSKIIDIFKLYGTESGFGAVLADSLMMCSACLLSSLFLSLNINTNLIILIVSIYLIPYFIFSI